MAKVPAITLTESERSELESLAAKMKAPYRDVMRAKMVLWLADGESLSKVARRSGFERTVVRRWRERFLEKRIDGLQDEERSGRPPTFPLKWRRRWSDWPARFRMTSTAP